MLGPIFGFAVPGMKPVSTLKPLVLLRCTIGQNNQGRKSKTGLDCDKTSIVSSLTPTIT